MPLTTIPLPYGLRDLGVKSLSNNKDAPGTLVDMPYGRTFSWSETEEFQELRGDDMVITTRGSGPAPEWELETGGIKLDAFKLMAGGTVVGSGVTPNQKNTFTKLSSDSRPFFRLEGQAISDSGGDFHAIIYAARATGDIEGELADGAFWLTGGSGAALPTNEAGHTNKMYEFVQNETAAAIA
jgi:hypothetical protein